MNAAVRALATPISIECARSPEKSMAELLSCGTGVTGPNAASYRIYMSLVTTVEADAKGGSTARVQFSATAQNIASGTSNDRVTCGSTGVLEQLLLTKIAQSP